MAYYWPFSSSHTEWIKNTQCTASGTFVNNRFGDPLSGLDITGTYITLTSNILLGSEFSITAWVKVNSFTSNSRIIEFGNTGPFDIVAFSYSYSNTGQPFVALYNHSISINVVSPISISVGQWTYLAATLNGVKLKIYINANLVVEKDVSGFTPRNIIRTSCYIGFSSDSLVSLPDAIYDQIKVYGRGLTPNEVYNDYIGPAI